ncbi:ImmA/IrrE family metallo-endopeptidase [Mesorhizobium sp. M1409]|uniref:ImmA/IrrE family metallo-endopeptidase n=1 Tax=unclassified Mesorhizobium TaxID=325217 RepID=UPI00333650C4
METTQLDGLSRWGSDRRPHVLLAQSFARRQFDAAHELAHLLLHRAVSEDELVENFKLIQDQAHRFASALLLPASQFSAEVTSASLWELRRFAGACPSRLRSCASNASALSMPRERPAFIVATAPRATQDPSPTMTFGRCSNLRYWLMYFGPWWMTGAVQGRASARSAVVRS